MKTTTTATTVINEFDDFTNDEIYEFRDALALMSQTVADDYNGPLSRAVLAGNISAAHAMQKAKKAYEGRLQSFKALQAELDRRATNK